LDSLTVNDRFEKAIAKKITQKKVTEVLGLSQRQVQRMVKQYRQRGTEGLMRKKSDKPPHNALTAEAKLLSVEMARTQFQSYGPMFAREYMSEYFGFRVGKEIVSGFLMEHGRLARIACKPRSRRGLLRRPGPDRLLVPPVVHRRRDLILSDQHHRRRHRPDLLHVRRPRLCRRSAFLSYFVS
jgi:transposase